MLYQDAGKSHRAVSESTAFLMSSMLADVINAGTAYRARQSRLRAAGGRQDRHDQRLRRRVVRRLHAAPRDRRVDRVRSARDDHRERIRRRPRGSRLGQLHESGDEGGQARLVRSSRRTSSARMSAASPASCPNGGCDHVEVVNRDGARRNAIDDLHRVFRQRNSSRPTCVRFIRRRRSWTASPGCLAPASRASRFVRTKSALPPAETGTAGAHPASPPPADVTPTSRRTTRRLTARRRSAASGAGCSARTGRRTIKTITKDQNQKKKKGADRSGLP